MCIRFQKRNCTCIVPTSPTRGARQIELASCATTFSAKVLEHCLRAGLVGAGYRRGDSGWAATSRSDAGSADAAVCRGVEGGAVEDVSLQNRATVAVSAHPWWPRPLLHREHDQLIGHLARPRLQRSRCNKEIVADHRSASANAGIGASVRQLIDFGSNASFSAKVLGREFPSKHTASIW